MSRRSNFEPKNKRRDCSRHRGRCGGIAVGFVSNRLERAERRRVARLLAQEIQPFDYDPRHSAQWEVY